MANFRVLDVAATGGLRVLGISLRNGNPAGDGGGIDNAGNRTLFESRLVANSVAGTGDGGGVSTRSGGRSLVIRTTIVDNSATNSSGGVFNAGGTTLVRTLILRDRATTGGGVFGAVTVRRSIVRGNTPDNCVPANPLCN